MCVRARFSTQPFEGNCRNLAVWLKGDHHGWNVFNSLMVSEAIEDVEQKIGIGINCC